jgi:hypothetical protein
MRECIEYIALAAGLLLGWHYLLEFIVGVI